MRITSVKDAEQKMFSGGEPDFTKSDISVARALNWYSYYRDYKDSKKYVLQFMAKRGTSKKDIEKLSKVPDNMFSNVGFVCRLTERGATLEPTQMMWIDKKVQGLLQWQPPKEKDEDDDKPKVNIQERIKEQTRQMVGELEGFVDNYKEPFDAYEWMVTNGVKSVHAKIISQFFTFRLKEPKLVLDGKCDDDLKEAYSHLNKSELKKFVTFIHAIISDAERIINNSKAVRKPRKKKAKSVDKIIAKVQYKKEDTEYKIVSIDPAEIIGAKQLWVFNTKTRKLGVYFAWTQGGLSIKGTTIDGYTDTSVSKTLRKPADVFLAIQKGTERKYKTVFDGIKSTEQALTGRLNTDTILLKVFK